MLINFSNHPTDMWELKQRKLAKEIYGEIVDLPFPAVEPLGDCAYIKELADKYLSEILKYSKLQAVHIMGEFTFCFLLVKLLQEKGIKCIASTTKRIMQDGMPMFVFEQFREYP